MDKRNDLMIKRIKKSLPLMLLVMVLLLSACEKKAVFSVNTNNDNSISVTADRSTEGSTGIGHLTVGQNEKITVDAAGMDKEGKLSLRFAAGVAEAGMILRESEWKGTATWSQALELVRGCESVTGDAYKEEFVYLLTLLERAN